MLQYSCACLKHRVFLMLRFPVYLCNMGAAFAFSVFFTIHVLFVSPVWGCSWDAGIGAFFGSPVEQALCLVSPLQAGGASEESLKALPPTLDELVGRPFSLPQQALQTYLNLNGLNERDVGGPLGLRVSLAQAKPASYFVIHDTAGPFFGSSDFPPDINVSDSMNSPERFGRHYHVIISRSRRSHTALDFFTPLRSTVFERKHGGNRAKGAFLHVALIQPRGRAVSGPPDNNWRYPDPAFTDWQYTMLAVVYLCASQRAERWLIPAYAGQIEADTAEPVDASGVSSLISRGDGPQGFDLNRWADAVRDVYRAVVAVRDEAGSLF